MIGNLFGTIVRIANAPIRAAEDLLTLGITKDDPDTRIFSEPGRLLAEALEDADGEREVHR